MKKHWIVLITIVANLVIFVVYGSLWLISDHTEDDQHIYLLLIIVSYIMPVTLTGMYVILKKEFTLQSKLKWVAYILLTSFLGSLHFYLLHKDDIQKISVESEQKMKEGPDSLDEFKNN